MEECSLIESIYQEANDGNVDFVLDTLPKIIDQLRRQNKLRDALDILLTTSSILVRKSKLQEASDLANLALKISIGQPHDITIQPLKEFAMNYPIEGQPVSMINFFLTLIKLDGDANQILRKKLVSFAELNCKHRPDFIQKMYLKLYKECFQANVTSQIIKTYTENSCIEAKEELKSILLNDSIPLHFARFLWSIPENDFDINFLEVNNENNNKDDNDNSNYTEKARYIISWKHTINAIFLRDILIVSLQSGSREKSSLAARTLYESILLSKPDNIDISVIDHPFYHFSNLITKLMINYKFVSVDSFKKVVDAYEKILFQDSEISILLSLISQKYFNKYTHK